MPGRLKVLHVTTKLSPSGGIEEMLRILARSLDRERFQMGICSLQDQVDQVPPVFRDLGVELFCGGRRAWLFDLPATLWVARVIRRFEADVVHTHQDKGNLHGRLAAFLFSRARIVTTHHDLGDVFFARTKGLARQVITAPGSGSFRGVRRVYSFLNVLLDRLCDRVIADSDCVRQVYTTDSRDARHVKIPPPYDEALFSPRRESRRTAEVVLGSVGRLDWQKGHIHLLHAFHDVVKEHPNVRLRIVGEGSCRQELESFVRLHRLGANVLLCGHRPHGRDLFDGIDIYVHPSLSEGGGIAIQEAMGLGLPVIASDIPAIRETIVPGETGLLVPPSEPVALGRAIVSLIDDRKRASEIGRRGALWVREHRSAEAFVERVSTLYRDLASEIR